MLSTASSMLEFHMLVACIVMLYILELIMEIVSIYSTEIPMMSIWCFMAR